MLHLQTLIDGLVDDLLRVLRGASLDELRGLLDGSGAAEVREPRARPAARASKRRKPVPKNTRTQEHPRRAPPPPEPKPPRAPREGPKPTKTTRKPPRPAVPAKNPPAPDRSAEITDPERLLAGPVVIPLEPLPHEEKLESPPEKGATTLAVGGGVRLRAGESLARAGSGVIRRAKSPTASH